MTIVAVESIPKTKKVNVNNYAYEVLDAFASSSAKIVKVQFDPDEFSSAGCLRVVLTRFVKDQKRPMKVYLRNGEVYLEKII